MKREKVTSRYSLKLKWESATWTRAETEPHVPFCNGTSTKEMNSDLEAGERKGSKWTELTLGPSSTRNKHMDEEAYGSLLLKGSGSFMELQERMPCSPLRK
jgi:hypothetical protein